ncbi:4-hydroxy-3-methylbut-2-enyl diphosphate reductase [Dethiosulfovibrio salsuginis]|uniref:4-hydroxy-3-methylbut-2-enyl diphosphate reductase n=1 Tax=Dethiosulfovibrio salsuginis TaxID=561720 RepID=A0A1X7I244_9BACT|nr:4-hydroxy-3-methylbut-2-enyl diphosphate reductase [Dethiosulfovibrio salsuginis]SMG08413.1 4-hydroxy-3-methylbut-2-enyl diphosphate reductase [Dethiosulfovibrio salsuginis]
MKVITAEPTGLCFGVTRAIKTMEEALISNGRIFCIGSPIHNPQEVKRLENLGLVVVSDDDKVPPGEAVFVRAHGISPDVHRRLMDKNVRIIDGTCPFVRKAQKMAEQLSREGYFLLVLGDEYHPEIQGILGYVEGPYRVISQESDLKAIDKIDKIGIISQTTQQESTLKDIAYNAVGIAREIRVSNTICRATVERQEAVRRLAGSVDGIVVIGGHNSANTAKLFRIAQESGTPALWVEEAHQLDRGWLSGKATIGIAAGASTPDWLIKQLQQAIL